LWSGRAAHRRCGIGLVTFVILGLFWKEFKLITFDAEFAGANGFRVNLFSMLLSTLIVIAIVLGLQLAGVILMVGMLIAPGIAARQWTNKLTQMVILAAIFGGFSGGTGAIISAVDTDIPTGPMIIVVAFLLVLLSIGFAPGGVWYGDCCAGGGSAPFCRGRRCWMICFIMRTTMGIWTTAVPHTFLTGVSGSVTKIGLQQLQQQGYVREHPAGWQLDSARRGDGGKKSPKCAACGMFIANTTRRSTCP
jgi:hypothetical protein